MKNKKLSKLDYILQHGTKQELHNYLAIDKTKPIKIVKL